MDPINIHNWKVLNIIPKPNVKLHAIPDSWVFYSNPYQRKGHAFFYTAKSSNSYRGIYRMTLIFSKSWWRLWYKSFLTYWTTIRVTFFFIAFTVFPKIVCVMLQYKMHMWKQNKVSRCLLKLMSIEAYILDIQSVIFFLKKVL